MNRGSLVLTLATILAISSSFLIYSGDSTAEEYAQPDDISVSPSKNNIHLTAGDSITIYLDIYNKFDRQLVVYVYYTESDPDVTIDFPDGHRMVIDTQNIGSCRMDITVNKYARSIEHELTFDIRINDPIRGETIDADASHTLTVSVSSDLSAGKQYNKILGVIDNHLPAPLNAPIVSAAITMAIWIFAGVVIAYYAVPFVIGVWRKGTAKVKGRSKE